MRQRAGERGFERNTLGPPRPLWTNYTQSIKVTVLFFVVAYKYPLCFPLMMS